MTALVRHPVHRALTRPQMFAGVTFNYFIINGVVTTEVFLITGSFWALFAALVMHGVGYVAFCSVRTLSGLNEGEAAVLHIETYVREDVIRLYGFASTLEREWFRLLQSVQGVGAKVALAVLSTLTPSDLANAIALQDKAMIARAPGRADRRREQA